MASVFVVAVGVAVAPPRASRWSPSPSSPSPLRSSSHSSLLPYRVTIASMWRRKREHSCALVRARAPRQREEKERVEAFLHSFFFSRSPSFEKKKCTHRRPAAPARRRRPVLRCYSRPSAARRRHLRVAPRSSASRSSSSREGRGQRRQQRAQSTKHHQQQQRRRHHRSSSSLTTSRIAPAASPSSASPSCARSPQRPVSRSRPA